MFCSARAALGLGEMEMTASANPKKGSMLLFNPIP
jgi:hypothetical protein